MCIEDMSSPSCAAVSVTVSGITLTDDRWKTTEDAKATIRNAQRGGRQHSERQAPQEQDVCQPSRSTVLESGMIGLRSRCQII
jgi:hypothetical protein